MLQSSNARWTPQWAPDGQSILFTDNVWANEGDTDPRHYVDLSTMYIATSDGTSIRTLSEHTGYDPLSIEVSPDLSPDGTQVVYATTRHGSDVGDLDSGCSRPDRVFELETVHMDGSNRSLLNTERGRRYWDVAPHWSPDGSVIAFARDGLCDTKDFGIYAVNSDGTNVRLLAGFGGDDRWAHYLAGPVWSPTGHALAFVYRVPAAHAAPWSPAAQNAKDPWERGEKADYFRDSWQPQQDILYAVNADGTGVQALYAVGDSLSEGIQGTPAWSSDGTRIAFVAFRNEYSTGYSEEFPPIDASHGHDVPMHVSLFTINPQGSELYEVGSWTEDDTGAPYTLDTDFRLEWSPDSKSIMVSDGNSIEIWDVNGSGLQSRLEGSYGSWASDGSRIAVFNVGNERRDGDIVLTVLEHGAAQPRILVRERVEDMDNQYLQAEHSPY